MLYCFVCESILLPMNIKYHTADKSKFFCGAECSLKYHAEQKEKKHD